MTHCYTIEADSLRDLLEMMDLLSTELYRAERTRFHRAYEKGVTREQFANHHSQSYQYRKYRHKIEEAAQRIHSHQLLAIQEGW